MNKTKVRKQIIDFLSTFGDNLNTKLNNICAKTGQYDVPSELFQKRTPRSNRVLICWKDVVKNNITFEQLDTFYGGVVVEFRNEDFFDEENRNIPLFNTLVERLGSDENISSIITIRSDSGSSSSSLQRRCFEKLTNNLEVNYKGNLVTININNYEDFAIKKTKKGGQGNEKWSGFLYVSIKGGQQDTRETHKGLELTIFNPACEYANEDVRIDIDLVLGYFALLSIDFNSLDADSKNTYTTIKNNLKNTLREIEYDSDAYQGNLYDYCTNHYCVKMCEGYLYDPIQVRPISINNFNEKKRTEESIDFTHSEAVEKAIYYWDRKKNCILSPARPTNVFWSFHLSNMMQQNYTLDEYFEYEAERFNKRQQLLNN